MRYTLDEFLALPQSEQVEYWDLLERFVSDGHELFCSEADEYHTDSSIGSGRIPQCVQCDCLASRL